MLELTHRLDFMLRQTRAEVNVVKALTAHICYWTSDETALFLLYCIYGPIEAGGGPQSTGADANNNNDEDDRVPLAAVRSCIAFVPC